MPTPATADFELIIGDVPVPGGAARTSHSVQVSSPAGPGFGTLDLGPGDEFRNLVSAASVDAPTIELRRQAGAELFGHLFQGQVRDCWNKTDGMYTAGGAGAFETLRLRLWFRDPALAALPWELLHDGQTFLVTNPKITLSRYLAGPEPSYLDPVPNLRVLGVISRPVSTYFEHIPDDAVTGLKAMFEALGPTVEYTPLLNPDLDAVRAKLADGYHVLHYLGHGVPNELIFTAADKSPQPVKVENLRQITLGRRTLRLVVLNACGSAQAGAAELFAGVGPGLVQVGVPAVVAMQYEKVYLEAALQFDRAFHPALVAGRPVDLALTEGRQAISAADVGDRGWSTPILYMGTRGGRVVEVGRGGAKDDAASQLRQAAAETEQTRQAFDRLVGEFGQVLTAVDGLENLTDINNRLQTVSAQLKPVYSYAGPTGQMLSAAGQAVIPLVWEGARVPLGDLGSAVAPSPVAAKWAPVSAAVTAVQEAVDVGAMLRIPAALSGLRTAFEQFALDLRNRVDQEVRTVSDRIRSTLGRFQ